MSTIKLRGVILRDEKGWLICQCLEHDICVQAMTMPDLIQALVRNLKAQIALDLDRGDQPFANIPRAPDRFFQIYDYLAMKIASGISPIKMADSEVLEPELRAA
ncbi:MAG TPA: hypothetical protein VFF06_34580 [Polyangia bacterium]|nr:hypothetical protein [Polyangia bacterium]